MGKNRDHKIESGANKNKQLEKLHTYRLKAVTIAKWRREKRRNKHRRFTDAETF